MKAPYDDSCPKKATNLSVNSDLLARARSLGINLSAVLERALILEVKRLEGEAWLRENRAAIEAYNREVAESGTFSDELRGF